ncbi:MAG: tyrosine-type recombinase/integrase [Candidatus Acidiferrales bacterium]
MTTTTTPEPSVRKPRAARGEVVLYRPKGVLMWYLRYSLGGTQQREPTATRDEKKARRLRDERQAQLTLGQAVPQATRTTFDQLSKLVEDDFATNGKRAWSRTEDALGNLARRFAGWKATAITSEQIVKYQRQRQTERAANSTINRECGVLKRAFRLGQRLGKVAAVPYIPRLHEAPPRSGFFERAEVDALLRALPDYLRSPVAFMFYTGWRREEVVGLEWRQVDLRAGVVRLDPGTTKNQDGRTFPFAALPPLGELLHAQRERVTKLERRRGVIVPWVFPGRGARRIVSFRKAWATACTAAGLAGRIPHDFRRTAVRNLERAGVPRSVAMKLVGHRTESVYRRYAIVSEADLSAGVAKLTVLHEAEAGAARVVVPLRKAVAARAGRGRVAKV